MPSHHVAGAPLDFDALRSQLEVPGDYPRPAEDEAEHSAAHPSLPDEDRGDIEFVTIDPAGSMDLDQAVHLADHDGGFLVSYAIADVASFVSPGGALDAETHARGETLYFPDTRVPLHPTVLSEGAASLLPDQERPAVLWQISITGDGQIANVDVRRARVRSRAKLDYDGVQHDADANSLHPSIALLPKVGAVLLAQSRARHAIDLDLPEQIVESGDDGYHLRFRAQVDVERWNAQISVLTGMCAARLMLQANYGILRTVPPPAPGAVKAMRRAARALGIDWPDGAQPGDVLAGLDRSNPKHVALIDHAGSLLRGSGYTVVDGSAPAQPLHAGIGAPYAHVTAPLRRLADRYASEVCLALHAQQPVPDWVKQALPGLPDTMAQADQRAHEVDRAVVDLTEAWLLKDRIGQTFEALVIDADDRGATIVLDDPAVRARCTGGELPVGERVPVRLTAADTTTRQVTFERAN